MPKIQNIIIAFLVLGLIYAEFLPTINTNRSQAYSPDNLTPTQSELLLAFFDPANKKEVLVKTAPENIIFVDNISDIPEKLVDMASDTERVLNINYTSATAPLPTTDGRSPAAVIYKAVPAEDQPFIGDVIPPYGTPLFGAYATGGRAWYQEGDNIVVIFPDSETFRSFRRSTGEETDWLQDRLNYDPLNSPGALENYLSNYHGEIVAETDNWVLVKFPSGGFLKIAKPETSITRPFFSQQ
ncbi:MAG: hypothetical protein V1807_01460 [Patescibacteria group bacterium]